MLSIQFNTALLTSPNAADGASPPAPPPKSHDWKNGAFSFHDVLDTLNPLQHLPIIGTIYRWLTGDEPGNVARIVGDGIYGGPIGLGTGAVSVAIKEELGKDPGAMVVSLLTGGGIETSSTKIAAATDTAQPTDSASTSPASAAPQKTAAEPPAPASPAIPFRPVLPLQASGGAVNSNGSAPSNSAEETFLARQASQSAALQRSFIGQHAAPGAAHPVTAPIPLQLTGSGLPTVQRRATAASYAPAVAANPSADPTNLQTESADKAPVEISQRMLKALDKYMELKQQRGNTVDLAQ